MLSNFYICHGSNDLQNVYYRWKYSKTGIEIVLNAKKEWRYLLEKETVIVGNTRYLHWQTIPSRKIPPLISVLWWIKTRSPNFCNYSLAWLWGRGSRISNQFRPHTCLGEKIFFQCFKKNKKNIYIYIYIYKFMAVRKSSKNPRHIVKTQRSPWKNSHKQTIHRK